MKKKKKKSSLSQKEKQLIQSAKILLRKALNPNDPLYNEYIPNEHLDIITTTQKRLLHQYAKRLIRQNIYGQTQEAITSLNMLDVSEWPLAQEKRSQEANDIIQKWGQEFHERPDIEKFLFLCPCFNEGTLRLQKDRYIHWKVTRVDLENKQFDIKLFDYLYSHDTWEPGTSGLLTVTETGGEQIEIIPDAQDNVTYSVIYSMLSPKSMGWTEFEAQIWKTTMLEHARQREEFLDSLDKHPLSELGTIFITIISYVNMALSENKPKAKPKTKTNKTQVKTTIGTPPEKKLRTINTLKITSDKPPRVPTRKSIIKYSIESWTCRGHTRRLKSGRLIYVKPSVHHRKALANNQQEPINTTLKLKG